MTPSFGELLGLEILEEREAKGWTQLALSERTFGDHQSERRIRDYELGKIKRPQAKVYLHICDALGISRQRISELKSISGDSRAINRAEVTQLRGELGSLGKALSSLTLMNREQIETLSVMFGKDMVFGTETSLLLEFLHSKAADYQSLQNQIAAIPPSQLKLSNIKSAAVAAIEEGDFEEVERLLLTAHELELEGASATAKLRAKNALLRGQVPQAAAILSAAADSLVAVDRKSATRRLIEFAETLQTHGKKYAGTALQHAEQMYRDALSRLEYQTDLNASLSAQFGLLHTLLELGAREGGATGRDHLCEADKLSEVLCVDIRKEDFPQEWAKANYLAGKSKRFLGIRADEECGAAILESAIAAFKLSAEIWEPNYNVLEWAALQIDWATVENYLGDRLKGPERITALRNSAARFEAVGEALSKELDPTLWSLLQNNLGVCYYDLGRHLVGRERRAECLKAKEAAEKALEIRDKISNPVGWSQTKNNLAIAMIEIGLIDQDEGLLGDAAEACQAALEIRSRDSAPLFFGVTMANLARATAARARLVEGPDGEALKTKAKFQIDEAIEIFDPETTPAYYEWAIEIKGSIG